MRTLTTAIAGLLCLVATATAHSAEKPDAAEAKAREAEVVKGGNAFAFDLYAKLAAQEKANLFFSPSSIHTALAMAYAGAAGQTATQMAATLHYTLPAEQLHPAFARLLAALNNPSKDHEGKPVYQLSVANALWGQQGFPFKAGFTDLLKKEYGAGLTSLDFAQSDAATKTINDWVARETKDKIKDLIAKGVLNAETALVLTNAIYFKSQWSSQFTKANTRDGEFKVAADKTVKAPMMHQSHHFGYMENDDLQVLEMPYKLGELSMLVLLPRKADGLADLEKGLTAENLDKWQKQLAGSLVNVTLPRFKFSSQFGLARTLGGMGMPDAFDAGKADFSGIAEGKGLFISAVIHKAFVAVDEQGTEAAAATAVVMSLNGFMPDKPRDFIADHPFIFAIRHAASGQILFLGRVTDPTVK